MNAVLSIKPKFAWQIVDGAKKVEFRKASFKKDVERVYIYSSSPDQRIIGYFTIKEIVKDSPQGLWDRFRNVGGIEKDEFFSYFLNKENGYSICIQETVKFERSVDPKSVLKNFVAPQSYLYTDKMIG